MALCTLANFRKEQIEKAVHYGKHIISEKPIADSLEKEWEMVHLTESANVLSTVNLYLRNSWYHKKMKQYVDEGELGELAIIRVCHMTPGLAPGEGHEYEGPAFHDCGMHYVDITRWYAGSEYKTWHAQGVRMWSYKRPVVDTMPGNIRERRGFRHNRQGSDIWPDVEGANSQFIYRIDRY